MKDIKISVVVPAFNEERGLAASLRSIQNAMAAFVDRGWPTELIASRGGMSVGLVGGEDG